MDILGEDVRDLRLFIAGGGCCSRIEITPVDKPLSTDTTYHRGGLDFHVEKSLVEGVSSIEIGYDGHRGLLIDLIE